MTHTVTTEIERKYEVPAEAQLPSFTETAGGRLGALVSEVAVLDPVELEAVYFDTADGVLAAARIALRRRRGGHDEGWHVKLPAAEGRTELQWPLDVGGEGGNGETGESGEPGGSGSEAVPGPVLDAVRVHVRDRALTPLARIATTRRITELRDAGGSVVAEIADDTVSAADLREGTARAWREWEAELGPAAPDTAKACTKVLDAIEQHLLAAGATVSPSVSKLAQAMGRTALGESPAPADAAPTTTSTPIAEPTPSARAAGVVRAGLAELVASVVALDPLARADEPDAVHRLRVTVRRLRSVLATHRALLGSEPAAAAEVT
ncbi:MAG: CYTH domain-containing protein, partial [Herbiconiux sp.]|nr:CYTH domain-containing protein [Herbiconiux sp.]